MKTTSPHVTNALGWATTYAFQGTCQVKSAPADFLAVRDDFIRAVARQVQCDHTTLDVSEQKVAIDLPDGRLEVIDLSAGTGWGYRLLMPVPGTSMQVKEECLISRRGEKTDIFLRRDLGTPSHETWFANRLPAVSTSREDAGVPKLLEQATQVALNDGLDLVRVPYSLKDTSRTRDWWSYINGADRQLPLCVFIESALGAASWTSAEVTQAAAMSFGLCHVMIASPEFAADMFRTRAGNCRCAWPEGGVVIINARRNSPDTKHTLIRTLREEVDYWMKGIKHNRYAALHTSGRNLDLIKLYLAISGETHLQGSGFKTFAHLERGLQLKERSRGPSPQARIEALEAENTDLRRQLDAVKAEARQWTAMASELSDSQEQQIEDLTSKDDQITALKAEVHRLNALLWETKPEVAVLADVLPATYDHMEDWCARKLANKVFLHPRAVKALETAQYEDVTLVYKALLLLGNEYRDMCLAHGDDAKAKRALWNQKLAELHLGNTPKDKAARNNTDYEVEYPVKSGHRISIAAHLTRGKTRDPRHCLRIYYAFDEKSAVVVVGHLPNHLPNGNE